MSEKPDRTAWIRGGSAACQVLPAKQETLFRLVLLGAPGVGKGTQAELLCERLGTCHLSTGDVFRAAKCLGDGERSPALESALQLMRRGELVSDGTVLDLVRIALDAVLNYDLPIDRIVSRLSGRRTCAACKAVFHVTARPPRAEGACDHCGGKLFQREDDQPEAIRVRMEAYDRSTKPLIDYYGRRGLLRTVSAEGSPEEIYTRTLAKLKGTGQSQCVA
jgi:adenylate kinase